MHFPSLKALFTLAIMGTTAIAAPSVPLSTLEERATLPAFCPPPEYNSYTLAFTAYFLKNSPYGGTLLAQAAANVTFPVLSVPPAPILGGILPSVDPNEAKLKLVELQAGVQFLGIFGKAIAACATGGLNSAPCGVIVYGIVRTDIKAMINIGVPLGPLLSLDVSATASIDPAVQLLVNKVTPGSGDAINFLEPKVDIVERAKSEARYFTTVIAAIKAVVAEQCKA
ncbi:hypothetical protein TWF694_008340 [Orbilia ellipsospora]|uniref:Uncharacterized protein n=1 Tax=Orbilia ellipsospora TaxID=2528407 RepID=A0AAV9XIG5_9PEZI